MATRVSTGGNVSFNYKKENNPKMSKVEKIEIRKAYEKARERRRKEKRNRVVLILIIILLILAGTFYLIN